MSIYALRRRTDPFGPDADRFRPERWATLRPIWDFVPFSGGPRHCPAQQLARSETGYVLARLARGFQGWGCRDQGVCGGGEVDVREFSWGSGWVDSGVRRWAIRVGRGDAVVKTGAKRSKGTGARVGLGLWDYICGCGWLDRYRNT